MIKTLFGALIALLLVGCGGGADGFLAISFGTDGLKVAAVVTDSDSAEALKAKVALADPTLQASSVTRVNGPTAGNQFLRAIGALADGGYAVDWGTDVQSAFGATQQFDSGGTKRGAEVTTVGANFQEALTTSGELILSDHGITLGPNDDAFTIGQPGRHALEVGRYGVDGSFLQRINPAVINQPIPTPPPPGPMFFSFFGGIDVLALSDGGFVVVWVLVAPGPNGVDNTVFAQRYTGQGQAVGGRVTVAGPFRAPVNAAVTFTLAADLQAGYTVGLRIPDVDFPTRTTVSAVHVDEANVATRIVAPRIGDLLLLPLETGFVLFTSNDLGAFEQRLDNAGTPVGNAVRTELFPVDARELADGSYVVFVLSGGLITAQRFDAGGTEIGDLLTVPSLGVVPDIAALTGGGFALAWTAPGLGGDDDVFTQVFTEVDASKFAQLAKRKACLDSARGMHGQQHKAFFEACLASH